MAELVRMDDMSQMDTRDIMHRYAVAAVNVSTGVDIAINVRLMWDCEKEIVRRIKDNSVSDPAAHTKNTANNNTRYVHQKTNGNIGNNVQRKNHNRKSV